MSGEVVRLPTAAPKKVRQCWSRTKAADRRALLRFPANYKPHSQRLREKRAAENAALMADSDHRAALMLAMSIYNVLDRKQQIRVKGQLLGHMALGNIDTAKQALAWVEFYDAAYAGRRSYIRAVVQAVKDAE